jgi:hypothetical protein
VTRAYTHACALVDAYPTADFVVWMAMCAGSANMAAVELCGSAPIPVITEAPSTHETAPELVTHDGRLREQLRWD